MRADAMASTLSHYMRRTQAKKDEKDFTSLDGVEVALDKRN